MTGITATFRHFPATARQNWPVATADARLLGGAVLVGLSLGVAVVLHALSLVVAFQ